MAEAEGSVAGGQAPQVLPGSREPGVCGDYTASPGLRAAHVGPQATAAADSPALLSRARATADGETGPPARGQAPLQRRWDPRAALGSQSDDTGRQSPRFTDPRWGTSGTGHDVREGGGAREAVKLPRAPGWRPSPEDARDQQKPPAAKRAKP